MSHIACADRARRSRVVLFASCAFTAGVLALSPAPVMAGCNSGSSPDSALLHSEGCQADASGFSSTAVAKFATAGNNAVAVGVSSVADVNATAVGTTAGAADFGVATGYLAKAIGQGSTAVGTEAGRDGDPGNYGFNSAFGRDAGRSVTGAINTAIGTDAGRTVKGDTNAAVGASAGRFVTGSNNAALGAGAGQTLKGSANTALGNSAGQNVTGSANVASGVASGITVKGSANAAYGRNAGGTVTGNGNVAIGQNAGTNINASNTIAIGLDARATVSGAVAIGAGSVANAANTVSVGTTNAQRRIVHVRAAVANTDAVNLGQVKAMVSAAKVASSKGAEPLNTANTVSGIALIDDIRRELSGLRALVKQQQDRIAQLERRNTAAAAVPD